MPTDNLAGDMDVAPVVLPLQQRQKIFGYLGVLIVLLAFGAPSGGLIDIPISFLLKNKLHLEASELANFRLAAALPLYLSCIFGFIRDTWNPFRSGDRAFMMMFGSISAVLYVFFAFCPVAYETLLLAVVLLTVAFLFVASAQNGLTATIGKQHLMTGQVSAVWNVFISIPTVAALLIGGSLSDALEGRSADQAIRILFLAGAAIMASLSLYAVWKPSFVFDNVHAERSGLPFKDFNRLLRHKPIYPALLIWLLWSFAPGSTTPPPVLPSEHAKGSRCPMGAVERDLFRFLHSDLSIVRSVLPKVCPENPTPMGDDCRNSADGSIALHSHGGSSASRGNTNRPHGWICHCRISGPDHSIQPAWTSRHGAHDVERTLFCRGAVWRRLGDEPLQLSRRLHDLRNRDYVRLRTDPPDAFTGAGIS
jgi:hypothetical protein